jgi:hypothetical protein
MTTINIDIAHDCPVSVLFSALDKYSGQIIDFIPIGPGGGNPNLTLSFPNETLANQYLLEFYG